MRKGILALLVAFSTTAPAQELRNKKDGNYRFTVIKNLENTPIEDQAKSNTCWSFSSLSYIESELLRMGKPVVNLSEMFIVYHSYLEKAEKYVRMHGNTTFAAGGAFHDSFDMIKKYGIVPQSVYTGFTNGETKINHIKLDSLLKRMVDSIVQQKVVSKNWYAPIQNTLDDYLGKMPDNFELEGKKYTPLSFASTLGLNYSNYIEITSFTHHPFYGKCILEIPDNWQWKEMYNVPLEDLISIINQALMNGYTVAWGADTSEPGFSFKNGVAIVSDIDLKSINKEKKDSVINNPGKQKKITQLLRQEAFDNYETTDDHSMHIVGIVKDQTGTNYYIVKNSWGMLNNECGGYFYASEAYVKYKTTSIMINKESLKKETATKLGL